MFESIPIRIYHSIPESIRPLLVLKWYYHPNNYLREQGWFKSEQTGSPINGKGEPIPWFSYPAIDFLENRLSEHMSVFEYGCGNSTLWWANYTKEVTGVEHDNKWATKIKSEAPSNAEILHRSEGTDYIEAINERGPVDIVVVDGSDRGDCVRASLSALSKSGVVVVDDYYRQPKSVYQPLKKKGYNCIPFYGATALGANGSATAVFYQSENCLNI